MDDWHTSHERVLAQRQADGWMFLIEAARDLRTTGAIAPSGRALARALTDPVRAQASRPLAVLEAGAGTGPVTRALIPQLSAWFLADRLRTGPAGRRIPPALWARAETLMARHGGRAVFLARFIPVVRTLAPHCAGAARLPYCRIAPYSATAACVWATAEASAGYAAASSLQHVLTLAGPAAAVLVLTATAAVLVVRRSRPHQVVPARR
ncbi:VTT domain-containing protein [Streptomyces sp.]|uniref:VTT domain-containing protein n=1 Tax=Streptomyces sp. TaxID=1931 RepID=UPI0025E2A36C|nr:VTT domain-containing protein [Streptomyces sp.]